MISDDLKLMQKLLLQIPKGRVTTYKEIGLAMGTKGYRYVGQLLSKNPEPDKYPCYKVIRSDGGVGGYAKGVREKIQRLRSDGIEIKKGMVFNLKDVFHKFSK